MTHYTGDSVVRFYPILLLFFAGMIGVVTTADMFFFLIFWEFMTLGSYFLVIFERESSTNLRAGLKYFIITHAATFCMMAAAIVLWKQTGSFSFDSMRAGMEALLASRPALAHLVLALFLIGFATKAGILPMGDWLPDAHPVAPSGMSAVLSGAMVKLGVYGIVRVLCYFVPVSQTSQIWGALVALAGTASLFVGTLTALRQEDSKRLMAFHTIGQVGYMCLGIGIGVYFLRTNVALAALGLTGGLFHVINHACFKSCLFLGAGSVLHRTGERNMSKVGGLAAFMPTTAGSSGVAAMSISGVPPFNGFASKWLIFAACILGGMKFPLFVVLGLVAMFISLVTLASFLKFLGGVFLGLPDESKRVREVPAAMAIPQVILAALCFAFGVFPLVALRFIVKAVQGVAQVALPQTSDLLGGPWGMTLSLHGQPVGFWGPLAVTGALVVFGLVAYAIQRMGAAEVRTVPVWYCGEEHEPGLVRYPSHSYYLPFKEAFKGIYPTVRLRAPRFPGWLRKVWDVDTWLYRPTVAVGTRMTERLRRTHVGIPQMYLLWLVAGAVLVIGIIFGIAR
jgi:hydrogenase-4 component B